MSEDKEYKAICKSCGGEVHGIDVVEHAHFTFYDDGYFYNIVGEETISGLSYYRCSECGIKTKTFKSSDIKKLKSIADLVETHKK